MCPQWTRRMPMLDDYLCEIQCEELTEFVPSEEDYEEPQISLD
jgi:hypothetical protein|tara:strand:- start:159 stop:287 length:129 start_codon:yes stop_codon:yes gene_type:complete